MEARERADFASLHFELRITAFRLSERQSLHIIS